MLTAEQQDLINNNIRFVHHLAKRFENSGIRKDEIVSSGYFGLVKAARTYSAEKGTKFTTYAGICITNSILDLLDDTKKRKMRFYKSLDEPISESNGGLALTVADLYDDGERIEEDVVRKSELEERKMIIGLYLINKSPRYAQIIKLRLQDMTHNAIAKEIGISKSYISRILTKIERELSALKSKIDKTDGEYIKKYSRQEIARARYALCDTPTDWVIQIERSCFELKASAKNNSVHNLRPSVNFIQKGLRLSSDLVDLIDPDADKLDILITRISDTEGVLMFKFRNEDAPYMLQKQTSLGSYIESSRLTNWLFDNGIIPKRYQTCYYDDAERTLYVKVECKQIDNTQSDGSYDA